MIRTSNLNKSLQLVLLIFVTLLLVASCGNKQDDENLKKAFEIHEKAVKARKEVKDKMTQLLANEDSLFVVNNAGNLKALSNALEEWDGNLVEVPGFHHHHDHDHDHDHDHNHGDPNLTSEQHIEVQQYLLDEIKAIGEKVNAIK